VTSRRAQRRRAHGRPGATPRGPAPSRALELWEPDARALDSRALKVAARDLERSVSDLVEQFAQPPKVPALPSADRAWLEAVGGPLTAATPRTPGSTEPEPERAVRLAGDAARALLLARNFKPAIRPGQATG
jgi:hypothetical protein